MAKAHCKNHKRFVPTCDPCKSEALKETVGFPGGLAGTLDPRKSKAPKETVNDIPDYEPDEEEPLTPAEEPVAEDAVPVADIDETEAAMEEAGEFDPASHPVTPGEGESDTRPRAEREGCEKCGGECQGHDDPGMSPIEMAMFMFPARLLHDGESTRLVGKALEAYLEAGLTPEDAVICVAGEVIHAEQLDGLTPEVDEEVEEAFEAGIEAAPEITGCIEDYNQGYNDGLAALHRLMIDYYAGDEDAVAYAFMRWLERQMVEMRK